MRTYSKDEKEERETRYYCQQNFLIFVLSSVRQKYLFNTVTALRSNRWGSMRTGILPSGDLGSDYPFSTATLYRTFSGCNYYKLETCRKF